MTRPPKRDLTDADVEALYALLDGRGETRKVPRDLLAKLLTERQRMLSKLEG